ncbi:MAG: O-antigen ligase family protein [Patescibacteria group bacterium]
MTKSQFIKLIDRIIEWLILAVVFLIPIYFAFLQQNYNVFVLNKLLIFRAAVSLFLILYLCKFAINSSIKVLKNNIIFVLGGLLFLYWIINTFLAAFPQFSFWGNYDRQEGVFSLIYYLFFFILLILNLRDFKQIKKIIITAIISSSLVCIYGFMQYLHLDPLPWKESVIRIFSSIGQPNFLAYYLILVIPITVFALIFISKKLIIRVLFSLALIAQICCLILTYSRGGWLGFLFSFAVIILLALFLTGHKKLIYGLLGSLVILISLFIINFNAISHTLNNVEKNTDNFIVYRLASSFHLDNKSSSVTRVKYWTATVQQFTNSNFKRKLLGYGKDSQENIFIKYYNPEWGLYERINSFPDRAHNLILDILLEFGLIGLTLFTLFNGYIILVSYKYLLANFKKDNKEHWLSVFLLGSASAYGFAHLFSFPVATHYVYWYLIIALLLFLAGYKAERIIYLKKINPISRYIIFVSVSLFLIFIFYYLNIKYILADYYYMEVKKAEAKGDCSSMLDNMNKVVGLYPISLYYKEQFIYISNNCIRYVNSKQSLVDLISNVTNQIDSISPKEYRYYVLTNTAHAYSLWGYYIDDKYYQLADDFYQRLLNLNPYITSTYQDYGRMKVWSGDYDAAIEIYHQGIKVSPPIDNVNFESAHRSGTEDQIAYFYELIGDAYFTKENFAQALEYYDKVLKIRPGYIKIYKTIADVYYSRGDLDKAIDYNNRAYRLDPSNSLWSVNLALLYKEKGDFIKALEYANIALKLEPDNEMIKQIIEEIK